jgi:POT family proton-dependent oligopeptide transporter
MLWPIAIVGAETPVKSDLFARRHVATAVPSTTSTTSFGLTTPPFFGHPRGLALLFGVEMWERFSYYGMRALLVLYLVNGLHWKDADAASLYGTYTGLAYGVQMAGGIVADRWLGTKRCLVVGGAIIALGHFVLAIPAATAFYAGLALVVVGTGLFKPNVSTMVGQLYRPDDGRRDAGFTIFYFGINAGAFVAPFVTGYLGERVGWHWGFAAAGVGMLLGLGLFLWGHERYLRGVGSAPGGRAAADRAVAEETLTTTRVGRFAPAHDAGRRVVALLLVFAFAAVFWAGYEQAGSSLNLFTDRHTNRVVGHFEIPTSWFQTVQPLAVLLFALPFAALWQALARRGREPSTPMKMTAGLALLGTSFVIMMLAGRRADGGALVSPWWLVTTYVVQVLGEMCLSPVGLSYVTKVAPARYASLLMATWFFATALGNKLAGALASLAPSMSNASFFLISVVTSLVAAALLLAMVPPIRRMTAGSAH